MVPISNQKSVDLKPLELSDKPAEVSDFIFKEMTPNDCVDAFILEQRYFDDTGIMENELLDLFLSNRASFICKVAYGECSKVIGFVKCQFFKKDSTIIINVLCVDAGFRRKHIGTRLVKLVIHRANVLKCKNVSLLVSVSNKGAQALYTKMGFNKESLVESVYSDNSSAWKMNYTVW